MIINTNHYSTLTSKSMFWVESQQFDNNPENIFIFETIGGKALALASNYPYELWLDGKFVGDGGHRCTQGEVLADFWPEAQTAKNVLVRLHWLNSHQTSVYYRCLFDTPFLADLSSTEIWTGSLETSILFAAKVSIQLPRQNIVLAKSSKLRLELKPVALDPAWKILSPPIKRASYIPISPKLINTSYLTADNQASFQPTETENLLQYVCENLPCELRCDTFDLGQIALYRFQVDTTFAPCVLVYSEVSDFKEATQAPSRAKVQMADAIAANCYAASPFGTRGCRYVHIIYPSNEPSPKICVWRREYPLKWKTINILQEDKKIIEACKTNLIACVDGGVVDTCWRERTQWTGDLRMSAAALRALTDNDEVVDLALHQIAQSYNPQTGMVNGAWPIWTPNAVFPIPTFHLAFCLTALEHRSLSQLDPLVRQVVEDTLTIWPKLYLKDNILQGMDGWYFTDWDPTDPTVAANRMPYPGPHAICNAWWTELCNKVAPHLAIKPDIFDKTFWKGHAYSLTANKLSDSPHATIAALNSSVSKNHFQECLLYLEEEIASSRLRQRITPYFACFVAHAFNLVSHKRALAFIRDYYKPIAEKYGSIYEKTTDSASLAHGWSVGIAPLLMRENCSQ